MASTRLLIAVFFLAGVQASFAVTPVEKVLTMMNEMKTKGEAMMGEEAKTYAAYKEWGSRDSALAF